MTRVLIVEDSHSQRECISHHLRWSGMEVIQAGDGMEALEKIQHRYPDLVLLDVMMPRIDGYDVCRLLKANPETRNIPIIFLTSKRKQFPFDWGIQNAEAYIGKPWQPKELLATIKTVLQAHRDWRDSNSADAWTEYGLLNLNLIKLSECRADVWTKYGLQITKFYQSALNAFEQALKIDPHHSDANHYRETLQKQWAILQSKLEQTKPCHVCRYYYGKDRITCAVHPFGPAEELCRDWDFFNKPFIIP